MCGEGSRCSKISDSFQCITVSTWISQSPVTKCTSLTAYNSKLVIVCSFKQFYVSHKQSILIHIQLVHVTCDRLHILIPRSNVESEENAIPSQFSYKTSPLLMHVIDLSKFLEAVGSQLQRQLSSSEYRSFLAQTVNKTKCIVKSSKCWNNESQ